MNDYRTRILIVVSSLEYGGAQRQIIELVNNLDSSRYLIHVASLSDYVPLTSQFHGEVPVHIVYKRSRFDVGVVFKLLALISKYRFQILHSYLFDAAIAVRLAGLLSKHPVKVIDSERNSDYQFKKIQLIAYKLTRHLSDVIIANSRSGANFNSVALNVAPEKYRVIYNGVDTDRFRPQNREAMRQRLQIPAHSKVVGVFASFKAQKNHPFLLDAILSVCDNHPELKLLLVGDMLYAGTQGSKEYRAAVLKRINDTKLKSISMLLGNRDDIENLYPACDVTVLPSRFEGTPNAILESMSCGIPVIATRVSDNDRIITNGETGLLVDPGDHKGLTAALCTILEDNYRRAKMGEKSRARVVKHFSSKKLGESTARVYDELVPQKLEVTIRGGCFK